jgi:hypothetical protein
VFQLVQLLKLPTFAYSPDRVVKMITTLQLPTGFRGPRLLAWLATVICKHS